MRREGEQRRRARSDGCADHLIPRQIFFGANSVDSLAQATDWRKHSLGIMALLQARTPAAHLSGNAHLVFVDFRLSIVRISASPPLRPAQSCHRGC